jgi:hypothetical protein
MIHPDTEVRFINNEKGYGVVATKLIPKGTITWVQDPRDEIYTDEQIASLFPVIQLYLKTFCFTNNRGEKILCWHVNHSFKPSCFSTPYDFEIAIRDIMPGEELTDDYGYLNLEEPFSPIDEGTARKVVYPDDLLHFHKEWDEIIKENLPGVLDVEQPLLGLVPDHTWNEFIAAVQNPLKMRSLLECYYEPQVPSNQD